MTDVTDLIARLEAASEGSRELDGLIAFVALGWRQRFGGDESGYEPEWEHLGGHWLAPGQADTNITHREPPDGFQEPPAYTTSLDAALTLVPDRWRFWGVDWSIIEIPRVTLKLAPEPMRAWAIKASHHDGPEDELPSCWVDATAKTIFNAVVIAALKARNAA